MTEKMVVCPECGHSSPLPETGMPDGTYTEICTKCLTPFSYVVRNGRVYEWEPPKKVSQSWNGSGKPGGS